MKNRYLLFLLLLVIHRHSALQAQGCFRLLNAQTGVEEYEGCFPFQVTVEKCATITANASYLFEFPEGDLNKPLSQINLSPFDGVNLTYTYNQPGTYYIAQYVNGATSLEIKQVKVFSPQTRPEFTWKICGSKLQLDFQDIVFSQYEFNPGNGSAIRSVTSKTFEYDYGTSTGTFTFSVKGVLPSTCNKDLIQQAITLHASPLAPVPLLLEAAGSDTLNYQVKISVRASEDFAFQQAGPAGIFSGIFSPGRVDMASAAQQVPVSVPAGSSLQGGLLRVATIKRCNGLPDQVFDAQAWRVFWPVCEPSNQKINIRWPNKPISGLQSFRIFRDGVLIASPPFQSGSYLDQAGLICGQTYTYHFETEVLRTSSVGFGSMKFVSPKIEAKAISNIPPPAPDQITATVLPGKIQVNCIASPLASKFRLFRRDREGQNFSEIGQGFSALPLTDTSARTGTSAYCYKINFEDICGNQSQESGEVCPVLLTAETLDGITEFTWTGFSGWNEGVLRYELIRKPVAGLPELPVYAGTELSHTQNGQDKASKVVAYQIKVLPQRSDLYPAGSLSNVVYIDQDARLRFPDAFTPNNDGINDEFACYGSFLKTYQLIVYNSWGNVVFSSDDPRQSWDGKVDGQPAQTGNYAYRAVATDETGKKMEKSGFIALIR